MCDMWDVGEKDFRCWLNEWLITKACSHRPCKYPYLAVLCVGVFDGTCAKQIAAKCTSDTAYTAVVHMDECTSRIRGRLGCCLYRRV